MVALTACYAFSVATLEDFLRGCESEPLHLSGAIQPAGALARVDVASGRVTHASRNLPDFGGPPVEAVLDRTLDELRWLGPAARKSSPTRPGTRATLVPLCLDPAGPSLRAQLTRDDEALLVEMEVDDVDSAALAAARREERALLGPPPRFEEIDAHQLRLVAAVRAITGFDRVMLYRFHEDWTGEVVAESLGEGVPGYLGLRFPASDIPAIARNLYLASPCRAIPDALAAPVPVVGLAPPPDLGRSFLRSVSPVHLEYLANMGVRASLSLRVRGGDRLWGLVTCHEFGAPRAVAPALREIAVRVTEAFGAGLTSSLATHRLQVVDGLDRRLDAFAAATGLLADPLAAARAHGDQLLALLRADGLALRVGDDRVTVGAVPTPEALEAVDAWLFARSVEPVVTTDHLAALFPGEGALLAVASGLCALKWRRPRGLVARAYWFRREVVSEVTWAGAPQKDVVDVAGTPRLSPRRSFAAWVETKLDRSRPFSNEERMIAARLRNLLAGAPLP